MTDLLYRTEDIPTDEILDLFVETNQDRQVIDSIKAVSPIILVGSRGVGKSFLLKVAEEEMLKDFNKNRVLPVYLTFTKSSLLHSNDPNQFMNWMLSRICSKILRTLRKQGFLADPPKALKVISGGGDLESEQSRIELLSERYEESWKNPEENIDSSFLPAIDDFLDAIEDICEEVNIKRINLLIDEAAHIFRPEQQRQFFTLFRDLRTSFISCNAAVYPGVTSFGESFQTSHDATFKNLDRDVLDDEYIAKMREMVEKQLEADSDLLNNISRNGQNFAILAYAASGNPRILLKTISRASQVSSKQINEVIREYYKTEIWSEHSGLVEKYPGHSKIIDWGRYFIESIVLPDLQNKNLHYLSDKYASEKKYSTCFFWIHRDSPLSVKEAIRLLSYTGIVTEYGEAIKATKSELGTRYQVNIGCLLSLESTPSSTAFNIVKNLSSRRFAEFGMNNPSFKELTDIVPEFVETDLQNVLTRQLNKSIELLDLTAWQKNTLHEINVLSIKDILTVSEDDLKKIHYIGNVRARRVKNTALASVYEYLNG